MSKESNLEQEPSTDGNSPELSPVKDMGMSPTSSKDKGLTAREKRHAQK